MFDDTGESCPDESSKGLKKKGAFLMVQLNLHGVMSTFHLCTGQQEHTSPGGTGIGSGLAFVGMFCNDQDDQVVLGLQGIWDHYYIQFRNIPKVQINQC